jgi:TrmH family RNA methyltransferase
MQERLDNIFIILVEPVYAGNVGSVARLMNNFSLKNMRIVGSIPQKNDFYLAVHSEDILTEAQTFPDLASAVADLDRVIAFSRRVGKTKPIDYSPREMGSYVAEIPHLKTGLVFGRETYGLTDDEADLCPLRCHIPANPAFPSFNLAQAVAIASWEIYSAGVPARQIEAAVPGIELDKIKAYMLDVMQEIGFFRSYESTNWEHFLSRMLSQLNPSAEMLYRFRQMFNRFHVLVKGKGKGYD